MRRHPVMFRLADITGLLGGAIEGDPDTTVRSVSTAESAEPGDLTFLTNPRYAAQLHSTRASAVIVGNDSANVCNLPRIVCQNPYLYLARVLALFYPPEVQSAGIHSTAMIESGACIGATASIGPWCHIATGATIGERVQIGASCSVGKGAYVGDDGQLNPNVVICADTRIGRRVLIHAGAIIGADGFGMANDSGTWVKIPQVGGVVIGDDVEIGANTTIDRGTLDDTVIGDGVKLDNQIQIGHNVRVGSNTAMAGCVGIAGSARIGSRCTIGGGAVVLGHLEVGDDVHIAAGTLVMKSVLKPGAYAGIYPMQSRDAWARNAARLRQLDSLANRIRMLEDEVRRLQKKE